MLAVVQASRPLVLVWLSLFVAVGCGEDGAAKVCGPMPDYCCTALECEHGDCRPGASTCECIDGEWGNEVFCEYEPTPSDARPVDANSMVDAGASDAASADGGSPDGG